MKKAKDEMRAAYKRSDFQTLERGKFHAEVAKGTSVVLLEPSVAKAFPTSDAVNAALSGLLEISEQMMRSNRRSSRARPKAARAD